MCLSFSDANPDLSDEDDDAEYFKEAVGEKPEDGKHKKFFFTDFFCKDFVYILKM